MVKQVYYLNPITRGITCRKVGELAHDEFINQRYKVEKILIDEHGKFVDMIYSNGTTERTYEMINIIFDSN